MNRRRAKRPSFPALERAGAARRDCLLAALLAAATFLVYAQAWSFGLVTVDDSLYVCPELQKGLTLEGLRWGFTTVHDWNWIPLTWVSLLADTELYGLRPAGYHLTNVVLHTANTVLLFGVLLRATANRGRSAFVAALFALHPLHVESVAWVSERKDVLSTMFGLLSLWAYVRYATGARWWNFGAAFLFFLFSLLSKQMLVTLPFVFLLLDYWPLARFRGRSMICRLALEKVPFIGASAAFAAIAVAAQAHGGATMSLSAYPLSVRCLNVPVAYVAYLWKTLFPKNLAVYYPHPGYSLGVAVVGLSAGMLLAVSAAAIVYIRRYPYLFVGWFWYLGTLIPVIGLVQIGSQGMADRYTYFPLTGVLIAVCWLVPDLVPAGPLRGRLVPVAALAALALLAVTTFSQISYWHDSVTLLRHSMECTPDNSVAHEFLGAALMAEAHGRQEDLREAAVEYEKAIRLSPRFVPLYQNRGTCLEQLGRVDEAIAVYREALSINEHLPEVHTRLGAIFFNRHEMDEAKRHFQRALEVNQNFAVAHLDLSLVCLKTGDNAGTILHGERALALDPSLVAGHHYIALALRNQGRLDEAIGRLRHLVDAVPTDRIAEQELAETLAMKQRPADK